MAEYDDYVWRLSSETPPYEVVLPHDLEWYDEFSWKSVSHDIKNTLTGAIIVHEYKRTVGRPITLQGKDDMGWIQRPLVKTLHDMVQESSLAMTLEFIKASYNESLDIWTFDVLNILESHTVMFAHNAGDDLLNVESIKRFGNFENDSWFKINSIAFTEVTENVFTPCT